MTPIKWTESFSVGLPAVDHEHKELIDLVAALQSALTGGADEEEVDRALGELMRSISAHFALEEKFMTEHRYDGLAAHKADHERLLDDLRDLMEGRTEESPEVAADRLGDWFAIHFRTHDARLHRAWGEHPRTGRSEP